MSISPPVYSHLAVISVTDYQNVMNAFSGRGLLNGLTVTKAASGISVSVTTGSVAMGGTVYSFTVNKALTLCAADESLDRKDAIFFWPAQNTVTFLTGTAATRPRLPDIETSQILLGEVFVSAASTYLQQAYVRNRAIAFSPTVSNIGAVINRTQIKLTHGIFQADAIRRTDIKNGEITREKLNSDRASGSAAPGTVAGMTKIQFVNGSTTLWWVGYNLQWLNLNKAGKLTAYNLAYTLTGSKAKIVGNIWDTGTWKTLSNVASTFYYVVG